MANINRDYIIQYSPKNSKIQAKNIYFYTSDKNTCNIFISIVGDYQDLSLEVVIVPPNAQERKECYYISCKKLEDKLYEFEAPNTIEGTYKCEIKSISGNRFNTSESFHYTVRKNLIRGDM